MQELAQQEAQNAASDFQAKFAAMREQQELQLQQAEARHAAEHSLR